MKYEFIRNHRGTFPIGLMCKAMEVGRSGFYAWLYRPESPRSVENRRLLVAIKAVHAQSRRTYGSPRVHAELKAKGHRHGKHKIARLMRQHRIVTVHRRKFKVTTDSKHQFPVAENKLARRFSVTAPNRSWVSDITYVPTKEGWLYLAVTLDLFHRQVVGWGMAHRIDRQLVMDAFAMALKRRSPDLGLLHHSDRGSQYASTDFQSLLVSHGVECSMSRKGNCWDNAVAESFFHTLKVELVYHRSYETRKEARKDIFEYIEVFYNRQRRHSALGYLSPAEFEKRTRAA